MKRIIAFIFIAILIVIVTLSMGCARTNQLWFTENGFKTKTYGETSIECELLPDGTQKAKFSSKKGMSKWEKIANYIRPDNISIGGK